MIRKLIYSIVTASLLIFSSSADTVIIEENTPNPGDTTTHTTYTTGSTAVTDNLVSQDWVDGSWTGSMFPDSSDINESIYLTGKDGKYAETVINSEGILTENELKEGLTSTFKADIRWWNQWESTVTMTQTATDTNGSTTQILLLEDTTNHNYQFNNYQNTLVVAPDEENTHGTLTARFDFDVDDDAGNWNGGHSGVDVVRPEVIVNYLALTSQSVSTVVFCYQKTPPTCPAQEEIADVAETIDEIFEGEIFEEDYSYEDTYINTEYIEYEYDWNDDYFYDDIYEEEEYFEEEAAYYLTDDFFFEDEYYDDTYYDEYEYDYEPDLVEYDTEIELEEFDYELNEDYYEEEYTLTFDDIPTMEEYFEEEYLEEEYFEEDIYELVEEFEEEYIVEEEAVEEEPEVEVAMAEEEVMEEPNEIDEQSSSESIIADEPEETTDVAEQEEPLDETTPEEGPSEGDVESGEVVQDIPTTEEKPKVDLDIKIATIEKVIQSKISNEMQRVSVTLDVVNEIISREMVSTQPDMSSYFNMNAALFDTRQLPGGDPAFFMMQASLDSYSKTIYNTQANLAGTDPVVQYQIKLNEARSVTDAAYIKLKGLLDARSN